MRNTITVFAPNAMRTIASSTLIAALMFSALPALAEEETGSSSSEVSSTSLKSSPAMTDSSSSSSMSRKADLGQEIKAHCAELSGKERMECVHKAMMDKKPMKEMTRKAKKALKKELQKNCGDYERGSEEGKSCRSSTHSSAKGSLESAHPRTAKAMKKMMEHRGHTDQ